MKKPTTSEHILAEQQRHLTRVNELPLRLQQWRQVNASPPPAGCKPASVPELDWQMRRRSVCSEVGPRDSLFTTFVLPPITDRHGR
ncbi:MAG: hypothetical protein ABMA26_15815 [Limisphaerales bacterium]